MLYHQFNTFIIVLLSYKSIIYKSPSLWYFPITSEHPTIQQHCKVSQYSEYFICKETKLTVPKSILYQHTAKYPDIANILSERRKYWQCNTFTSVLLSDKSIIKTFNKPLIFYQFQSNIQPIIHQYSDLLSILDHIPAQNSTSLWSYINFGSIYSKCLHSTLTNSNSFFIRSIKNMMP